MLLFAPLDAAPKFVRAPAAVVAFVPPCATVTGVAVKADVTICVGVALFVAGVVGQAVIKLLYIDSAERHRFKDIHRCMSKASEDWGFTERVHQRSKDGVFHTVVHKLKKP